MVVSIMVFTSWLSHLATAIMPKRTKGIILFPWVITKIDTYEHNDIQIKEIWAWEQKMQAGWY